MGDRFAEWRQYINAAEPSEAGRPPGVPRFHERPDAPPELIDAYREGQAPDPTVDEIAAELGEDVARELGVLD